jgi:hypothetical protein
MCTALGDWNNVVDCQRDISVFTIGAGIVEPCPDSIHVGICDNLNDAPVAMGTVFHAASMLAKTILHDVVLTPIIAVLGGTRNATEHHAFIPTRITTALIERQHTGTRATQDSRFEPVSPSDPIGPWPWLGCAVVKVITL